MIRNATDREAAARTPGRTLAITSGKGGVGKTNLALNLAIALSELGNRVLVLDADIGLSNVDLISGVDPPYTLADALLGKRTLPEILADGPSGIKILSGGSGVPALSQIDDRTRGQFIREIRSLEREFHFILIDTGTGLVPQVTDFVLNCREIVVVTTAEPTAITDTYAMIKFILGEHPDAEIQLLVNMATSRGESEEVFDKLNLVISHFLKREIAYLGCLPADRNIPKAVRQHQPFVLAHPKTEGARGIREIARTMLNRRIDRTAPEAPRRSAHPAARAYETAQR